MDRFTEVRSFTAVHLGQCLLESRVQLIFNVQQVRTIVFTYFHLHICAVDPREFQTFIVDSCMEI